MKILFVAMPSVHFIRWIENLKGTKYKFYWFDILDRKELSTELNITKITNWKERKIPYLKGEYLLHKKFPKIFNKIQPFLEVTKKEAFQKVIDEIKPDLVHSFEMQSCSYPLIEVMQKNPKIKWLYSCWGTDLYYYKNIKIHKKLIKKVLDRINYLHTDCIRDFKIAKELGFNGNHVGVIPGGTGYDLENLKLLKKPLNERNIILIKGYEHNFGRAINVLKALTKIKDIDEKYRIVVFGCHASTINYIIENNLPYKYFNRNELSHSKLIELYGKSRIYIGNSISDGMPNTLLEAIVMGVFPIQSNPGGVTEEIIDDRINGLIINEPNNVENIKIVLEECVKLDKLKAFEKVQNLNQGISEKKLSLKHNKEKVIELYKKILNKNE